MGRARRGMLTRDPWSIQIGLPPEDVAVYFDDGYVHYEEEETDPRCASGAGVRNVSELEVITKVGLERYL